MIKKETWIFRIIFEGVDSQWWKIDQGISTVAEVGILGFEGNEVLGISVCNQQKVLIS